jgi:hypothetical protein
MTLEQAKLFLELIGREIGDHRCVVYSGNVAKEALGDLRDAYMGEHRLWLAQYGSRPVVQRSWEKYWLWQYSDGNVGPVCTENSVRVDLVIESPNVSDDGRAVLLLTDAVRLAVQVEGPA